MKTRASVLAGLLAALAGCGDPEIGPDRENVGGGDTCTLGDSDPSTDVRFDALRDEVFRRGCGCHTTPGGLGQVVGGLNLDDWTAVVETGGRNGPVVEPGDPCNSVVIQKTGNDPPFGSRMPLNGLQIPADQRQRVIDWIAEGALK